MPGGLAREAGRRPRVSPISIQHPDDLVGDLAWGRKRHLVRRVKLIAATGIECCMEQRADGEWHAGRYSSWANQTSEQRQRHGRRFRGEQSEPWAVDSDGTRLLVRHAKQPHPRVGRISHDDRASRKRCHRAADVQHQCANAGARRVYQSFGPCSMVRSVRRRVFLEQRSRAFHRSA